MHCNWHNERLVFDWHHGKIVFFLRNVYDGKVRPLFCSANFLSKYFSLSLGSYNHDSELQCHKPVFGHELKIKWFPVFLSLRWNRKTIESFCYCHALENWNLATNIFDNTYEDSTISIRKSRGKQKVWISIN